MIKISEAAVMTVLEDGRREFFDFDRLRARLVECCRDFGAVGEEMAEDIAFSAEYFLRRAALEGTVFAPGQIDAFVCRFLEKAGLPEISWAFRHKFQVGDTFPPEPSALRPLIGEAFRISGEALDSAAARTAAALSKLGVGNAPRGLVVEMARYMIEMDGVPQRPPETAVAQKGAAPWHLTRAEIEARMSGEAMALVRAGIITPCPANKFFPAAKISLDLAKLARSARLEPPIIDMQLMPVLRNIAGTIAGIVGVYEDILGADRAGGPALPVFIKLPGLASFAEEYLGLQWPGSSSQLREILALLGDSSGRELQFPDIP